ncbi:MAG: hypothetical protein IPN79_11655 [Saprospiraceae bacterium]|nr:hypothetical protein [Saprospiraceae bacterium]
MLVYPNLLTSQQSSGFIVREDSLTTGDKTSGLSGFSYFHPLEKDVTISLHDTTLHHHFTRVDPTKIMGSEHITLGNTFSAANRLLFSPEKNVQFFHGYRQYDVYRHSLDNAKFYTSSRPQTDVYFSQFSNQLNFSAGARVSIPFQKGFSFSIDYFRVNEQGFYLSHALKSTNLTVGLKYASKKYTLLALIIQHAQDEENNGGIFDVTAADTQPLRRVITTNINQAKTRHQERTYAISQYVTLAGSSRWNLFVQNNISYTPSYYKFSHLSNHSDTTGYYGRNFIDQRGLRRFLDIQYSRADILLGGKDSSGLDGKIGLQFDYFTIKNDGFGQNRTDLTAVFSGSIPFFKVLQLQTKGALGLAENAGNFKTSGSLNLSVKKWARLKAEAEFFLSEPSYASQVLVVNNVELFRKNWLKSFGTTFSGTLDIPLTQTSITAVQSLSPIRYTGGWLIYLQVKQILKVFSLQTYFLILLYKSNKIFPSKIYILTTVFFYRSFQKISTICLNGTAVINCTLTSEYSKKHFY